MQSRVQPDNQSSDFNSLQKKSRIEFNDLINQLSQPSTAGTPTKEQVMMTNETVQNQNDQSCSRTTFQRGMNIQENKSYYDIQNDLIDNKESSSIGIAQLNERIMNLKVQQQAINLQNQHGNIQDKQQISTKKPKVNVKDMKFQLDDLKDHIKSLESKIEFNQRLNQSSKKSLNSRSGASSPKSQRKTDSNYKPSNFIKKMKKTGSKSNSKNNTHKKNISWGEAQQLKTSRDKSSRCNSQTKRKISYGQNQNKENKQSQKTIATYKLIDKDQENQSEVKFRPSLAGSIIQQQNGQQTSTEFIQSDLLNSWKRESHGTFISSNYRMSDQFQNNQNQKMSSINLESKQQQSASNQDQKQSSYSKKQSEISSNTYTISDGHLQSSSDTQLPASQQQLLSLKIKECDIYKSKCSQQSKKIKVLKSQLLEKEGIINNYKSLNKELKTMKEQWIMSEDLRNQQNAQIKKMEKQLTASERENAKLRKKIQKMKQKDSMPIKVRIQEKQQESTLRKLNLLNK